MRILVVSDTHGHVQPLESVARRIGPVDCLLHAGDFLRDMPAVARLFGLGPHQCHGVVGNSDYPETGPAEVVLELAGVRILVNHGHRLDVKRTVQRIAGRGLDAGARVAIFGHSHVAMLSDQAGLLLLNPGSPSLPRLPAAGTCALLVLEGGDVRSAELVEVD